MSNFPFEIIEVDSRVNHGNSGGPLVTQDGKDIGIVTLKYIPFLDSIYELQEYVINQPRPRVNITGMGLNLSEFMAYVNEGIIRMSKALDMVQVGIGWIIPIENSFKMINQK